MGRPRAYTADEVLSLALDVTANALDVVIASGAAVMGTVGIDQTTPGSTNAVVATGNVAHDGADSGNPVKVGGRAVAASGSNVASNDRTDFITDNTGRHIIHPYAPRDVGVQGLTAAITDTTSTQILPSAGASLRNYVTTLQVINSHATVGTLVNILDAGGATLWTVYAPPLSSSPPIQFPMPLKGGSAVALHAQCVTTGANVFAQVVAFKWT